MGLPVWLQMVASLGPQILMFTPLARIAPAVAAGIQEAQQMAGADGPTKLAHVTNIAVQAAQAVNAKAGHVEVDPETVRVAAGQAISTVVTVVNMVHAAHAEDAAEAAAAPAATRGATS